MLPMDSFLLPFTYFNPPDKCWDGTSKLAPATFEFEVDKLSDTCTEPVSDAALFINKCNMHHNYTRRKCLKYDFKAIIFLKKFGSHRAVNNHSLITEDHQSVLLKVMVVVYFKNHKKHLNTLCEHNEQFSLLNFRKRLLASSCISVHISDGTTWLLLGALSLNFIVVPFAEVC